MTDGPLKSNSTMCCRGQRRRGRGGEPLLLCSVRLVWLPLRAAAEAAELLLPFASCVYFSLLHVPEWVERSCRRSPLPPPLEAYRDLLGLEKTAALPLPLDLHGTLIQDYFSKTSEDFSILLQLCGSSLVYNWFWWILFGPGWPTSSPPQCETGVSEEGRCKKEHEFDAVPLGAEQFHHETGRLNTSRSSQSSNTRGPLKMYCFSVHIKS